MHAHVWFHSMSSQESVCRQMDSNMSILRPFDTNRNRIVVPRIPMQHISHQSTLASRQTTCNVGVGWLAVAGRGPGPPLTLVQPCLLIGSDKI